MINSKKSEISTSEGATSGECHENTTLTCKDVANQQAVKPAANVTYTASKTVTSRYAKSNIDKYLSDPSSSKQIAKLLQEAKLKTNSNRLNPQPNLKNTKKRKPKGKQEENNNSDPNDSDDKMEFEEEKTKKDSQVALLREENKKLKDQLRQLSETVATNGTKPLPTRNRYSLLSEEGINADDVSTPANGNSAEGTPRQQNREEQAWITVIKNKNRKASPRGPQRRNARRGSTNVEENNNDSPTEPTSKRKEKVPPITIYRQEVKDTIEVLSKVLPNNEFKIKRQNDNLHKITVNSYVEHKKVREILKEVDAQYYTFTPRQEKVQTFMLKGIDSSFKPPEVLSYLQEFETPDLKFLNVSRHTTPKATRENRILPLFRVQISSNSIAGKLHEIKHVAHQVIWWEKMKKQDTIQCKNCQRLGHMASNCNMKYRCVKCNVPHGPQECQLNTNRSEITKEQIYCVLCQEFGHPASYRGCPKQAEYKAKRTRNNINYANTSAEKNRNIPGQQERTRQIHFSTNSYATPGISFADRAKGQNKIFSNAQRQDRMFQTNDFTSLLEAMQQQVAFVMQAVIENSQKIDRLFQIVSPTQSRTQEKT